MEGDLQMNFQNCNKIESWPIEELFLTNPDYPYNMQVFSYNRRNKRAFLFYNLKKFKRLSRRKWYV